MKILATLIVLLAALGVQAQTPAQLYAQADAKFEKKDFEAALKLVNKAIALAPDSMTYVTLKGYCLYALHKEREADNLMDDLLENNADNKDAYYAAVAYYTAILQHDKAIAIMDAAFARLKNLPKDILADMYWTRASSKRKIMDYKGAHDDNYRGYKLDTTNINGWVNLAITYNYVGKPDSTIIMYKKILAKEPANIYYYNNLAFFYLLHNKPAEALELVNKGLKIINTKAPNYSLAIHGLMYSNHGFANYQLGNYKQALKDFEQSIELYPSNSYVYKNRALVYIAKNKKDDACKDLYQAILLGFSETYGDEVQKLIDTHCR